MTFNHRNYSQLIIASVLLCTFVLQAGAMPCGCVEHNQWLELLNFNSCHDRTNEHHAHHQHELLNQTKTEALQLTEVHINLLHKNLTDKPCSIHCDQSTSPLCLPRKFPSLSSQQPLDFSFLIKKTEYIDFGTYPTSARTHLLAQRYPKDSLCESLSIYLL
jgi:hypothetical protein